MKEQIEILWELQKVDIEIIEIDKKQNEIPKKKDKLKQKLKELEEDMSLKEEAARRVAQEKEQKEKEIEHEEQKIKMVESRLSHIRNQKDYQDVRRKIELAKKSNKLREDEVISKMEELEKLSAEAKEFRPDFEKEKEKIEDSIKLYENEEAEIQEIKKEITGRRTGFAGSLAADILRKYETLRKGCRGIGVSRAKNEACEGCFMNLPPQLFNMVIKGDKLYQCPFCQRFIVYIPEEGNDENVKTNSKS